MADLAGTTPPHRLKGLPTNFSPSNSTHMEWFSNFLDQLNEVWFSRPFHEGMRDGEEVLVWHNQSSGPTRLTTRSANRPEEELGDARYLYPSDIINILLEAADRLKLPAEKPTEFFANFSPLTEVSLQQNQTAWSDIRALTSELLTQTSMPAQNTDVGGEDESAPADSTRIPEGVEDALTKSQPEPTEPSEKDVASAVTDSAVVAAPTISQDVPPAQVPVVDERERRRLIRYETTWLYHHVAYNLFGQHGIDILGDFEIEGQLQTTIAQHLEKKYGDTDLKRMFADPTKRLVVLGEIYQLYAHDSVFVGRVRAKYDQHLAEIANNSIETAAFLQKTKYEPTKPENYLVLGPPKIEVGVLQSLNTTIGEAVGQTLDGVGQLNLQKALDSVSVTMGLQGLDTSVANATTNDADALQFVDQLSADQLVAIFFANPDGSVNQELLAKLAQDSNLLAEIKSLLKGALAINVLTIAETQHTKAVGRGTLTQIDNRTALATSTINAVQAVRAIMPSNSEDKESTIAGLTEDGRIDRTKLMMDEYEKRIRKTWNTLDKEVQLDAYRAVRGLKDSDQVDVVLEADGSIPWNSTLMILRWDEFLRKQHKKRAQQDIEQARKLEQARRDVLANRADSDQTNQLLLKSNLVRLGASKAFLKGLTDSQIEQLRYTDLISKLEEAVVYAENIAASGNTEKIPLSSVEFQIAVDAIRIAELTIDEQLALVSQLTNPEFRQQYASRLSALKQRAFDSRTSIVAPLYQLSEGMDFSDVEEYGELVSETNELYILGRLNNQQRLVAQSYLLIENAPALLLSEPNLPVDLETPTHPDLALQAAQPAEDLRQLALASLAMAAHEYNQNFLPKYQRALAVRGMAEAASEDLALARGLADIAIKGKGNLAASVVAALNKLRDKEFRQLLIKKAKRTAKLLLGAIPAGLAAGYLIARALMGMLGSTGGMIAGAIAGGSTGAVIGSILFPGVGTVVGMLVGGAAGAFGGQLAGSQIAAQQALFGAGELTTAQASQAGLGGSLSTSGVASTPGGSLSAGTPATTGSGSLTGATGPSGSLGTTPASSGVTTTGGVPSGATPSLSASPTSVSGVGTTTSAGTATAAGAATATTAGILGVVTTMSIAAIAPLFGLGAIMFLSMYTVYTIFSAFLTPLPIGDDTQLNAAESQYLSISKVADPKSLTDNSTKEVRYTITIRAKSRYKIRLTSLVDTANNGFEFASARTPHTNPTITPSGPYISLLDFGQDPFVGTKQYTYKVTMSGGSRVMVKNRVTITYDVLDGNDQVVKSGETISASANVGIGDHGIACWPTTGRISQLPLVPGSYSHANLDAYDIGASLGTKVFSPVSGFATYPPFMNGGYGNYVLISFDNNGRQDTFIFAHLSSSTIPRTGKDVEVGELIGRVGSTGKSTGPHLHFGIQPAGTVGRSRLDQYLLLNNIQPPTNGTRVYSCYD